DFRRMGRKPREALVGPAREIDDLAGFALGRHLGRLDDVETIAVEEERVVAEHVAELCGDRMVLGNRLGLELAQSAFDLRGTQSHCLLLSVARAESSRTIARAIKRTVGKLAQVPAVPMTQRGG